MIIFKIISLLRICAVEGFFVFLFRKYNVKITLLISFMCAPIKTSVYLSSKAIQLNGARLCQRLGPIYVKFGQSLSSRPDLIGADLCEQLKLLQDKLQPFPSEEAKSIIERELKTQLCDIFDVFEDQPVASASIAQVHKATLKNKKQVAVKVLRPDVSHKYHQDVKILKILAFFPSIISKYKRLKFKDIIDLFEQNMVIELNLLREAASCDTLYENFIHDETVQIPRVYWEYATPHLLITEWIDAISIYNIDTIPKDVYLDRRTLAKNLAILFFNQAYRDGYFHADLHPGNIMITLDGKIALVDFGLMGYLALEDRITIAEILYSFLRKDYIRVAELHKKMSYIPEKTDLQVFAQACRSVAAPILWKPVKDISIGDLLAKLFTITEEFGMQTQVQLLMLQKTMVVVEGIGRMLDPNVNMWVLAEPWIKEWAKKHLSVEQRMLRVFEKMLNKFNASL